MADQPHPQAQSVLEMMDDEPMPPIHALGIETARAQIEQMDVLAGEPLPVGTIQEFEIPGPADDIPVRLYVPAGDGPHPVVVFYHGGGFVLGSLDAYETMATALVNAGECAVLSVDYRLAPEDPFPAAVEDAYAALEWVAEYGDTLRLDSDRIAVCGESAGANLSAVMTLMTKDRDGPDLAHQALIYPAVGSPVVSEYDSHEENAEGYFLERETMESFLDAYLQNASDYRNEYFAPMLARDLSHAPPATVITAGFDPLRDEGRAYAERLREEGVDVTDEHYEGMIHGFVFMREMIDAADDAIEVVADGLDSAF